MTEVHVSTCRACDAPATRGWQRWATPAEVQAAIEDPTTRAVQPHEVEAKVQVLACDEHAIDEDLTLVVHGADCAAPPACNCRG